MKVTANFGGRKSGAIGICHHIEITFEIPELSATEERLTLELYNRGYEHIRNPKFTVINGKLDK